jgi:hypothetical protein
MQFLLVVAIWVATFFLLIAVHELGHYLAGWAAGIPRSIMRIRLRAFPQHVALWDGERWVSPLELDSYLAVMSRYLRTTPRLYLYTAGGLVFETAFTAGVSLTLLWLDRPKLVVVVAGMSLWIVLSYAFFMDIPQAIRRGHPWGDVSGMWWLAQWATLILFPGIILVRVGLLWASMK